MVVRNILMYATAALVALVIPFPRSRIAGGVMSRGTALEPPAVNGSADDPFDFAFSDFKTLPGNIVDNLADTWDFTAGLTDDACNGCEAKNGFDCNRCAYFLASIDKIKLETVSTPIISEVVTVSDAKPYVPMLHRRSLLPAYKPEDAPILAQLFVDHLRDTDKCGTYKTSEFSRIYKAFCAHINRRPTGENHLKAALIAIPGVSKERVYVGPSKDNIRDVLWTVSEVQKPMETVAETVASQSKTVARVSDLIPTLRAA